MRLFLFFFLHLLIIAIIITTNSYADDKIFTYKPVVTGIPLENGHLYIEKEYDEKTPLLSALTTTQILINHGEVFYKNNKNRQFEKLIPSEYFYSKDLSKDEMFLREIEEAFVNWDRRLNLESFKSFFLLYRSFADNGDSNHSIKRISINKQNNRTSEITLPLKGNIPTYFILRMCEGEKETDVIQHFIEKSINKKLS